VAALLKQVWGGGFKDYEFEVEVDGERHHVTRSMIMTMCCSVHSSGNYMYPFAAVNDGLLEVIWLANPGFNHQDFGAADKRKALGYQSGYEGQSLFTVVRGKKFKFTYVSRDGNADYFNGEEIPISVDGEPLTMKKFYTVEVIPDGIEYMFDPAYFRKHNSVH